jgi:phycobilisome rod-core linker protein
MSIPLLEFSPSSQNTRVPGFEVPGDEHPRLYSSDYLTSTDEMDWLIQAAYRQVFHQQQMLAAHRLPLLESQLRNRQITVKTFIRGLATSDAFRRLNYEVNNNYRFVELCLQRLLGRSAYHQRETLAFSILLATHGVDHLIDTLLNHPEYYAAFGEHTVPYQRRRILPLQPLGLLPFERMPRYGTDYRDRLPSPARSWHLPRPTTHSVPALAPAAARLSLTLLAASVLLFALLLFNTLFVPS